MREPELSAVKLPFFSVAQETDTSQHFATCDEAPGMSFSLGVVTLVSGEVQMCTELTEHVSRKQGRDLTTEGP